MYVYFKLQLYASMMSNSVWNADKKKTGLNSVNHTKQQEKSQQPSSLIQVWLSAKIPFVPAV